MDDGATTLPEPATSELSLTAVMQALADPVRREIAARLAHGPEACRAIGQAIDLHKSTMSHHYKVLREAGVTRTVIEGRERYVCLRRDDLDQRFPGLIDAVTSATRRD